MRVINLVDEVNRSEWLVRFYEELLQPAFSPFPDELDSLSTFYYSINNLSTEPYKLHITLLVDSGQILAGCCYEYYSKSRCCLLTYIVVSDEFKGMGLSKTLILEMIHEIESHYGKVEAIFTESNSDSVDESKDVMSPKLRRQILNKLGFSYLDIDYVQPPLSKGLDKSRDLLLGVYQDYLVEGRIKSLIVLNWLEEFWNILCGDDYLQDRDWTEIQNKLESKNFINVLN
jgi:N-acetylglutamate synthase-like GNAT family acetyltransferase